MEINLNFHDTGKTYNGFDIWEAQPDADFWALWNEHKDEIKKQGISVRKYNDVWTVSKWIKSKIPAKEKMEYRVVEPEIVDESDFKKIQYTEKLFDYQIPHVQRLIHGLEKHRAVLDASDTGTGKALCSNTKILTFTGYKLLKEIKVNDKIIGSNGKETTVLGVYPQGIRDSYKISFSDDTSVFCDKEHLWNVRTKVQRYRKQPYKTMTTENILNQGLKSNLGYRWFIPMVKPIEFINTKLLLDPYLLGVLIGDGCLVARPPKITTADNEISDKIKKIIPRGSKIRWLSKYDYSIPQSNIKYRQNGSSENTLTHILKGYGLMNKKSEHKFIPKDYLFSSIKNRIKLLQGLIDTDGCISKKNNLYYYTSSFQLAKDVRFLIQSLGGKTFIRSKKTKCLLSYRLCICLPNHIIPATLKRKLKNYKPRTKYFPTRAITKIEPAGKKDMICLKVNAPDGLFVIDHCIVTHNTYTAISVCKELGLKPIVVCPKSIIHVWKKCCEYFEIEPYLVLNYEQYKFNKTPYLNVETTEKIVREKKTKKIKCFWNIPADSILIFDEAHRCKDRKTINSKMLIAAKDDNNRILCLSATVGDNPMHLFAVGYAINLFPKKSYFPWMLAHGVEEDRYGYVFKGGLEYLSKIHKQIFPHLKGARLRIKDLGDKFPDNLVITDCYEMKSSREKINKIYASLNIYIRSLYAKMKKDKVNFLTELLRARQEIELLKVETIVEMVEDLLYENHSVVIFVNFSDTVKALKERLKTKCVIWGNQSATERDKNIEDFQSDKERVIICNIRAGGVGISLHDLNGQYSRVSLISPSYSAQDLIQALGRIHRAGSKSKAIQKIIFCAGTVEEKMAKKVRKKIKNIETLNDNEISGVFDEDGEK